MASNRIPRRSRYNWPCTRMPGRIGNLVGSQYQRHVPGRVGDRRVQLDGTASLVGPVLWAAAIPGSRLYIPISTTYIDRVALPVPLARYPGSSSFLTASLLPLKSHSPSSSIITRFGHSRAVSEPLRSLTSLQSQTLSFLPPLPRPSRAQTVHKLCHVVDRKFTPLQIPPA